MNNATPWRPGTSRALIVTSQPEGMHAAQEALVREGLEPIWTSRTEAGAAILPEGAALVLQDMTDANETMFVSDLTTFRQAGRARLFALVRRDQIDQAAAYLADTTATILCEPHPAEWRLAFAGISTQPNRLNDHGRDEVERLQQVHEEIARIAETLSHLGRGTVAPENASASAGSTAAEIRAVIRARRMRERIFQGGLLSDPAWDMLLDLKAAELEQVAVSTTDLCIAAAAPPTTALRWISVLEKAGLVERCPDPQDRRRTFIRLSSSGSGSMSTYLEIVRELKLPIA